MSAEYQCVVVAATRFQATATARHVRQAPALRRVTRGETL